MLNIDQAQCVKTSNIDAYRGRVRCDERRYSSQGVQQYKWNEERGNPLDEIG